MELNFLFLFFSLSSLGLAASNTKATKTLIYLGEVFVAPAMTFIAWHPSSDLTWCHSATTVSGDGFFTLPGATSELQIQDYFGTHAWISKKDGSKYADCAIGPNAVRLDICEGIDELKARAEKEGKTKADLIQSGELLLGTGRRKWTCWVLDD